MDAPWGVSEWDVSGLTPVFDCEVVKAPRVKEAVFSVEVKIESVREWESRREGGEKTGVMVVLEGVRFWVRGDGIDEERSMVDPAVGFSFLFFSFSSLFSFHRGTLYLCVVCLSFFLHFVCFFIFCDCFAFRD